MSKTSRRRYLLTVPTNWRYNRHTDWEVGQANTLKNFIKRDAAYLFNKLQDSDYSSIVQPDATNKLFGVLYDTLHCICADNRDAVKEKFVPRLRKIHTMFAGT